MKILMVNKFLHPNGGSETYIFKLGEYLSKIGHEVQYFGMEHEARCVGNETNIYINNMDFYNDKKLTKISYPFTTIYSWEARRKIRILIDEFKPNLVHLNNINYQITPSIIYEIKKAGIPIVQTVHDVQIVCPNHRYYIEHRKKMCVACEKGAYWKCAQNRCIGNSFLKSIIGSLESYYYHIRNTYNLVDLYICPSEFISEKIQIGGVESKRIKVMYNFSEKIEISKNSYVEKEYILYFGRLSTEKGVETLLEVVKNNVGIHLIIAGRGPLETEIKEVAKVCKNIEFLGFKSGKELHKLIAEAKFTVYPSEWYENCPLSIIESQALGTPVVGSNYGGTRELIIHNKTGLIFEGRNKVDLQMCIESLWNNDKLIMEMKNHCLKTNSNYIESYTLTLVEEYQKLMNI